LARLHRQPAETEVAAIAIHLVICYGILLTKNLGNKIIQFRQ
jgi:hypothetical protein